MTPLNYHNLSVHASSSVSSTIGKTSSQLKDLHGLSLDKIVGLSLFMTAKAKERRGFGSSNSLGFEISRAIGPNAL